MRVRGRSYDGQVVRWTSGERQVNLNLSLTLLDVKLVSLCSCLKIVQVKFYWVIAKTWSGRGGWPMRQTSGPTLTKKSRRQVKKMTKARLISYQFLPAGTNRRSISTTAGRMQEMFRMFIDSIDEVIHHLCRIIIYFTPPRFYSHSRVILHRRAWSYLLFTGWEVKSKLIS